MDVCVGWCDAVLSAFKWVLFLYLLSCIAGCIAKVCGRRGVSFIAMVSVLVGHKCVNVAWGVGRLTLAELAELGSMVDVWCCCGLSEMCCVGLA